MKTYKRNFSNGRFARETSYRELPESVKQKQWMVKWMVRGFIAVLLFAGVRSLALYTVAQAHEAWNGVISHQKMLYEASRRVSEPVLSFVAPHVEASPAEDVNSLKQEVVEKLRKGESAGHVSTDDGIFQTFDPAPSMAVKCKKSGGIMPLSCSSFGEFQAKVGTVQMWQKMLGGEALTDREAMELALDTPRMTEFVTRVIFDIPGSVWSWSYASHNRVWFNEKITHIRAITN